MTSNDDQYSGSSKRAECQLSMRLLCRLIASIFILYTASTKPVLFWRLAYLLCQYCPSNSNLYCARSKPVECQLSMISLLQSITSTAQEYCANSKTVICQCLAQYWKAVLGLLLGYNWHNTALVVNTGWPPTFLPELIICHRKSVRTMTANF